MIIQNKSKANWFLVQSCIRRVFSSGKKRPWQFAAILLILLVGTVFIIPKLLPNQATVPFLKETEASKVVHIVTINPKPVAPVTGDDPATIVTTKANATQETDISFTPDKSGLAGNDPESLDQAQLRSPATTVSEVTQPGLHDVPGVLGQMKVKRHETLGGLIQTIYGVFNTAHLQSVLRINPHINNPDTISVGEVILFPAIASHVQKQSLKRWWVQLTQENTLEAVFSFLRQDTAVALSARLIPYWNRSSGLHFSVLLNQPFFDEASAVNKLEHLRSIGATKAGIVSEWDAHTVFYANPYQYTNT
jgi:hypothetical protein